jgi:curved DNA-binding protein CbpA
MLRRCVRLHSGAGSAAAASGEPFAMLGLRSSASREDVKKAYRELAKQHHPDSGSGDATKMEAVNRAYNLLIKENAYDDLHVPARPGEEELPPGAVDPEDFQRIIFDKQRLANLDPKTERVTPDGKFMYADRDTGEWTTVERPIARPEQPRYASHGKFRRDTDLFGEIKKKQKLYEDSERKKTRFQKYVTERYSESMPFDHPVLVCIAIVIYMVSMYFIYQRALSKRDTLHTRWDYYGELREHRLKVRDVYPVFQNECDVIAAAAVLVYLAAADKTSPEAPEQPAEVSDLHSKAPFHLYLLYNAM